MLFDELTGKRPARPGTDRTPARNPADSQLFLLRLWLDDSDRRQEGGDTEGLGKEEERMWRGKVQHVVRGEAHAFNGWEMLIDCLEAMLQHDLARWQEQKQS